jgi:hypothetical protein
MRFNNGGAFMRRAAMGPAAIAARAQNIKKVNLGIPQNRFTGINAAMMTKGGSLGCCGLGSYLSGDIPPQVVIGPMARRMINLRQKGVNDHIVLLDAITTLHQRGVRTIDPATHLQLAAGLQPMEAYTSGGGLGSLGDSTTVKSGAGAAITGGSAAASSVGVSALTAIGLAQTAIPIPVIGAAIGVVVWAALHFSQRHVGAAEASWTSPGFYASLNKMNGRDYDEKQFSEAFKGMMDTGNNIVPGCGADRHKDPDCLLGPMANVIAQGYLSSAVPLTATTSQVFNTVVKPWLASGAGGLVNWRTLAGEPIQMLMMQAATDRYLAGQAMTRGDMPSYGNIGAHTPTLFQALQPILAQAAPSTTTPQVAAAPTAVGPVYLPASPPTSNMQDPSAGGAPPIFPVPNVASGGSSVMPSYPPSSYSSSGGPAIGTQMLPGQSAPITTGLPITAAGFGGGLPNWAVIGIAVVGLGFLFFKQGPVTSAPKV